MEEIVEELKREKDELNGKLASIEREV